MRTAVGPLVRIVSALCALALVAGGALLAVEAVAALAGVGPALLPEDWVERLRDTFWDETHVARWLWVVLGVGLLALIVALWPRPPATVGTRRPEYRVERRSLESSLTERLQAVDGVSRAKIRVKRRGVDARLTSTRQLDTTGVQHEAAATAQELQERLGVDTPMRVVVRGAR